MNDDQLLSPSVTVAYAHFTRRLLAIVLDVILLTVFIMFVLIMDSMGEQASARVPLIIILVVAALYDPILVSGTGGTVGHHLLNLKVVADRSGGRLSFGRAVVRTILKGVLGLGSFIFMGVTRRHQSLHDLASHSTVQIRDLERAHAAHILTEREVVEPQGVSRLRRVLVILVYVSSAFLGMSFLGALSVSDTCALGGICSPRENLIFNVVTWSLIGFSAVAVIGGWRGRLPGCREKRDLSAA